jgi:HEAT repeat protein
MRLQLSWAVRVYVTLNQLGLSMRLHAYCVFLAVLAGACSRGVQRIDYSVEKLTRTLKDKDPNMRYWAAESLGHYGPEAYRAVPHLIEALKDENHMVRVGAAYALAEMGAAAESARPAIQEATKDSDTKVREAALYALKQLAAKKKQSRK